MRYFLSIIFCVQIVFAQSNEQSNKTPNPTDYVIKKTCPTNPDLKTIKELIDSYMESERHGHLMPKLATDECLAKETRYRVVIVNEEPHDNTVSKTPSFFIDSYKIEKLKKYNSSRFSDDYLVDMEIKGRDKKGKARSIKQTVVFAVKKGMESELHGCVEFHSSWKEQFINKSCLKD